MNKQKRRIIILSTVALGVIFIGVIFGLTARRIWHTSTQPAVSHQEVSSVENTNDRYGLGEEFTLKPEETAKIQDDHLEVAIKELINSPCPWNADCSWSGVGIDFSVHHNDQTTTVRFQGSATITSGEITAFGYIIKIIDTDYTSYATLAVEKIQAEQSS